MKGLYRLAMVGTAAKGLIYVLTAATAALAAISVHRAPEDPRGVMNDLFHHPWGPALLAALAIALTFFSLWRFSVAATGRRPDGTHVNVWMRLFLLLSAVIHMGFACSAARVFALRQQLATGDGPTRAALKTLMDYPFGETGVVLVGLGFLVAGGSKLVRSWRAKIWNDLTFGGAPRRRRRWIVAAGRIGEATRGVILVVCGGYALQAAARYNPADARGFAGALQALASLPFGSGILLAVAGGLLCYGLFLITSAKYQKI